MPPAVLLVEDETALRDLIERVLVRNGYRVRAAAGAAAALALEPAETAALGAAVVDLTLPDGTGHAVLRHLRAARPDLPLIAMSGWAVAGERYPLEDGEPAYSLMKPFLPAALVEMLARLTGQNPPPKAS
jgi:CheY-like chemotaxis protein